MAVCMDISQARASLAPSASPASESSDRRSTKPPSEASASRASCSIADTRQISGLASADQAVRVATAIPARSIDAALLIRTSSAIHSAFGPDALENRTPFLVETSVRAVDEVLEAGARSACVASVTDDPKR